MPCRWAESFGLEPVATFKINPLDVERFALLDNHVHSGKEAECPFGPVPTTTPA